MAHNQEMLVHNAEKWKDRVRIVALSVDDEKETVVKRIKDKNWDKIEHYKLSGWDKDHPAIKWFKVRGIPKVALVDTSGKIVYIGHPSSINLEEKINQLLEAVP